MRHEIVIDRRFRGPPDSGHGGYTCGLLAREVPGAARVSLRAAPPLGRPLTLQRPGDGRVLLRDGETIVAEAQPATLEFADSPTVTTAEAEAAALRSGPIDHPFPGCFGCGHHRDEGDGLRLFPGPVDRRDVLACLWRPDATLTDEDGHVRAEFVWAALDCPTGWACELTGGPIVLGRLTARIDKPLQPGEQHIITAWRLGQDGRKQHSGCTISTADGELLALSRALWIAPQNPTEFGAMTGSPEAAPSMTGLTGSGR